MAKDNKKLVEAITSMDVDFAQWYTDVVKKGGLLIGYSSGKGLYGDPSGQDYAIWEHDPESSSTRRFKETGGGRMYTCRMFIPESLLEKEEGSRGEDSRRRLHG